jgi:hypothetical protein
MVARNKYRSYRDVPYCRRASVNTWLAIGGAFLPFLLLWVCIICLSGEIYRNDYDQRGDLITWHWSRKLAAVILFLLQMAGFLFLLLP